MYFEYDLLWPDFGKLWFPLFAFFIDSLGLNMRQDKNLKKAAKDQCEFGFIKYNVIYLNQLVGPSQIGPRQ